jgi:hypothetical protein
MTWHDRKPRCMIFVDDMAGRLSVHSAGFIRYVDFHARLGVWANPYLAEMYDFKVEPSLREIMLVDWSPGDQASTPLARAVAMLGGLR